MFSTRTAKVARRVFVSFVVIAIPSSIWFAVRVDKVLTNIEESIIGPHDKAPDDSLSKALNDQRQILDHQTQQLKTQEMLVNSLLGVSESHLSLTEKVAGLQKQRGERISRLEKRVDSLPPMDRILKIEQRLNNLETAQEIKRPIVPVRQPTPKFFNGRKHSK